MVSHMFGKHCFNFHSLALKASNNEATPLQTEYISLDPSEAMVNIIMYIYVCMLCKVY